MRGEKQGKGGRREETEGEERFERKKRRRENVRRERGGDRK